MNRQHNGVSRYWIGGFLVILGSTLILMNIGIIESLPLWRYWPALLILFGAQKIVQAENPKEQKDGFWYAVIGAWLLVSLNRWFDLGFGDTWPFLIIAWGVSVMWESIGHRPSQTLLNEEGYGK